MCLVTIGIPVYNEESHLAETIESAINQDFKDIRIIISDNKSTDGSTEIIRRYSNIDNRIKPIFLDRNKGPRANYYSLINNSDTKYFVLLGGHDLFLPDYVGEAVAFLESNPDYVMCYPKSKLADGNEKLLGYTDSDIDTTGLKVPQRMRKVATNLDWCTSAYGVFRMDMLRKLPTLPIRGSDQLYLFAAAYYGHIHFMDKLGILRREHRHETPEMTEKRRIADGIYTEPDSKFYNSWSVMSMEHVLFILNSKLSLLDKITLSTSIAFLFSWRFKISPLSMLIAYIHRNDNILPSHFSRTRG